MNATLRNISLALAILLLVCLLPMPYGYYTLIRFAAMIVFGCMAVSYYEQKNLVLTVVMGALALLFQPFAKIALGRDMWNVVDVVVAVVLIYIWMIDRRHRK